MLKFKLTQEEREDLHDLLQHPGYPALVKVLEVAVTELENQVLTYNLESGEGQKLLLTKARAEGAKKALVNAKAQIASLASKR